MSPTPRSSITHPSAEPDTRQAIYDAMVELIYSNGYNGAPLRTLAENVGIRMASLYYHYPRKQDLLVEIMSRTLRDLINSVSEELRDSSFNEVDLLRKAIFAHVTFHAERRKEAFVTDSEMRSLKPENHSKISALRDEYESRFATVLQRGRARHVFSDLDERLALNALMAMGSQVAIWYRPEGRLSVEQVAEGYTQLFLTGTLVDRTMQ
jgi:AcrR family transcriptional regulator